MDFSDGEKIVFAAAILVKGKFKIFGSTPN